MLPPDTIIVENFRALGTMPGPIYSMLAKLVVRPQFTGRKCDKLVFAGRKCADIWLKIRENMKPGTYQL